MCNIRKNARQEIFCSRLAVAIEESKGLGKRGLRPLHPEIDEDLCTDAGASVQQNIAWRSGARRDKALVPLVQAGDECGSKHGDAGPSHRPLRISCYMHGFPPGAEQKEAKQPIAENVAALAYEKVPLFEVQRIDAKQKMQQRIKNPAGIVGRKPRGRLNRDDDQPQNCGDPRFESLMTVSSQLADAPSR